MEPIWMLLPDWMGQQSVFSWLVSTDWMNEEEKERVWSSGRPEVGSGRGERFSKLRGITWRSAGGWQMRRKSRAGWRWWAAGMRGDVLDSIKRFINSSFHLINGGRCHNGCNSRWHWIKKGWWKSLADWLSHLKGLSNFCNQWKTITCLRDEITVWVTQLNGAYLRHEGPVNTWH